MSCLSCLISRSLAASAARVVGAPLAMTPAMMLTDEERSGCLRAMLTWSAVLVGVLIVLLLVIKWLRRGMKDDESTGGGFTLGDLRDLHRKGQLSDEEFQKAKAKIVAATP